MNFDATLRHRWTRVGDTWRFEMPTGWMQGRSVYGGLSAAAAAALAFRNVDTGRSLRTLTVHFLGPVSPGPVEGAVQVLREGKSTTFVDVRLLHEGRPTVVATAVFAKSREGTASVAAPDHQHAPDVASLTDLPYLEGLTPECTKHVALRWASGALPFSGAEEARFTGYCRFRMPAGDVEGLLGLLDAWPSPSLAVQKAPAPESSISWTAHVVHVPEAFEGWFWFEYETVVGDAGYHTVAGRLYGPDFRLVAWTEQLVAVFGA